MSKEDTIKELIQTLYETIMDCLHRTGGDVSCYIDTQTDESFEEYWEIIMTVCSKSGIDLKNVNITECFEKANLLAAKGNRISLIIEDYIAKYNQCTLVPQSGITVSIPYVMNYTEEQKKSGDYNKYTVNRETTQRARWDKIEKIIKKYERQFREQHAVNAYDFQDYRSTPDGGTRNGKGSPDMIQFVISKLIDDKDVKEIDNNKGKIEKFMKDYAIGIDCSGFVTRTLATVFEKLQVSKDDQFKTIGSNGEKMLTNCTFLAPKEFINGSQKNNVGGRIIKNNIEAEVRIGDIICTTSPYYHVKIIYNVEKNNSGLVLYTAESTSDKQQGVVTKQITLDKNVDKEGKILSKYTLVRPYYIDKYYKE